MARLKRMITLTIDPELWAALDRWTAKQQFPPPKNAVIAGLLRQFLVEEGVLEPDASAKPAKKKGR